MRTVNSISELKRGVREGETSFYVANPRLFRAIRNISTKQHMTMGIVPPAVIMFSIGVTALMTCVLYAILKGYDIEVEYEAPAGRGKVVIKKQQERMAYSAFYVR